MCATSAFVVFLCLLMPPAVTAPFVASPGYDAMQPAALNEAALRRAARGDDGTALILLERAAVLDGANATIAANRDLLLTPGATLRPAAPAHAADAPSGGEPQWDTLPALWPAK